MSPDEIYTKCSSVFDYLPKCYKNKKIKKKLYLDNLRNYLTSQKYIDDLKENKYINFTNGITLNENRNNKMNDGFPDLLFHFQDGKLNSIVCQFLDTDTKSFSSQNTRILYHQYPFIEIGSMDNANYDYLSSSYILRNIYGFSINENDILKKENKDLKKENKDLKKENKELKKSKDY